MRTDATPPCQRKEDVDARDDAEMSEKAEGRGRLKERDVLKGVGLLTNVGS
jgi:hypothetical protein